MSQPVCTIRRYAAAEKVHALLEAGHAEFTPTGARTYNVMSREWLEWYIVPADDPRLDMVEDLRCRKDWAV